MRTESATPVGERFLMISSILTDSFVKELDGRLIPESMTRFPKASAQFKDSAARYLEREKEENRVWCFTLYAYADIPIGRKFNMLFDNKSRASIETTAILQFSILCLGGLFPAEKMDHGHKHICVFDFPDGIPQLITSVPKIDPAGSFSLNWRVGVTDSRWWNDIPRTLWRQEKP